MTDSGAAAGISSDLRHYLQQSRESLLRALDGIGEHDSRRPLTPTGTNLLGLVKHLVGIEAGYLGECVGRRVPLSLPWYDDGSIWQNADLWATADETREHIVGLYREVWAYSDAAIAELPLDTPASVSWWPARRRETTFGHLLVRTVAETAQHAGHADIVRELVDGRAGRDHDAQDGAWWTAYLERVTAAADAFRGR
jgi:hypothetical protein